MKRKILAAFLIIIIALSAYVVLEAGQPVRTRYIPPVRDSERPPSETASDSPATSTPPTTVAPAQLQAEDFPISIASDYIVAITNNSKNAVEVYDFKLTYTVEGGTGFGTTRSTPHQLAPGQSSSYQPAHSKVVAMNSVSVSVRADGQEIVVTYTVETKTPEPPPVQPIQARDFLITVVPNRQVTITNNSKSNVQVLEFSMTYECYSYIYYNAPGGGTQYGPIVRTSLKSEESVVLRPGQSYPKTFNRQDMVAILSCRFVVKDVDTGKTLTVTYP